MHPVLEEMLRSGETTTPDGDRRPLESHVHADEAAFLEALVRARAPKHTIEIGLAMGVSALAICGAAAEAGAAPQHVIVDPKQHDRPLWAGIGLHNLARAGFAARVEFLQEPSHRALASLDAAGRRFDFAFIDGFHTFDFTLVDFFFVDRMLEPGGIVAFDDADWPSVLRVVRYVATNRAYAVEAAMPPRRDRWSLSRRGYELVRRAGAAVFGTLERVPGLRRLVAASISPPWRGIDDRLRLGGPCVALRKLADDTRRYDHHVEF